MAKSTQPHTNRPFRQSPWRAILILLVLAVGVTGLMPSATASQDANLADAIAAQRDRAYGDAPTAAVLNDLGNLLVLDSQTQAAIEAYRRALELDPGHLPSGFNLGLLLDSGGQQAESLRVFLEMLEQHPDHARTHYQVGSLLERSGKRPAAIDAYVMAFQLDPFLALPDVNPQITDNDLVTEALLRVEVEPDEEAQAARIYSEPSRVAALLLPFVESGAEEAPETEDMQQAEIPVENADSARRQVGPDEIRSSPSRNPAVERRTATEQATSLGTSEDEETEASNTGRTLGAEDLSRTRTNQATPSAGGGRANRRTPANRRAAPQANSRRTPAAASSRGTGQPRATSPAGAGSDSAAPARPRSTSPTRFRPGRRSSAQLELRIVPAAGTPSLAATGGAR